MPTSFSILRSGSVSGCLHFGQSMRISRWAMIAWIELATRNGLTPMSIRRVIADGASLVCSVENTRWPVSAAWIAMSADLAVADLADEDDVRRLTQHRPQDDREAQADVLAHLDTG